MTRESSPKGGDFFLLSYKGCWRTTVHLRVTFLFRTCHTTQDVEYGNSAADHVKLFRTDWHLASANMQFVLVSHCARQIDNMHMRSSSVPSVRNNMVSRLGCRSLNFIKSMRNNSSDSAPCLGENKKNKFKIFM